MYVSPLKEEIVTAPSQVMRIIERGNGTFVFWTKVEKGQL